MRRWTIAAAFVTAVASVAATTPAGASHAWANHHWARTTSSFTLQMGTNLSGPWGGALDQAIADWSESSVIDLVAVSGTTSAKQCKPSAGRVEVCNANYGRNGWLGIAQIWLSNGHIVQGVAKMNDTYFSMPQYDNTVKRQHVMCQEVGHTFGLGHQSESGADLDTCMDYATALDNPSPNAHDHQQLATIYGHTDGFNSYAPVVPGEPTAGGGGGKGKGYGNRAEGWGRAIGASHSGAADTFVLDLGDGDYLVTHVRWIDSHHDEH